MITKFKIFESKHFFKEGDYVVVDNINDIRYIKKPSEELINFLKNKVGTILEVEPFDNHPYDFLYVGYKNIPYILKKDDIYYYEDKDDSIYLVHTDETRFATPKEIENEKLSRDTEKYNL